MSKLRLVATLAMGLAGLEIGCDTPPDESPAVQGPVETTTRDLSTDPPLYDGPSCRTYTQVSGTHRCPLGSAMTGAHFGNNIFRCRQVQPAQNELPCAFVTTQRNGMAACQINNYMAGYNVSSNTAICCPYPSANHPTSSRIDGNPSWMVIFDPYFSSQFVWDAPENAFQVTMRQPVDCNNGSGTLNMHACQDGEVMEGVHVGNNDLTCAR
jgi:hypothetical protein